MVRQWPDLSGRMERDTHVLPIRVYYEDTDFTGVVYHGSYVRFFERARSDFLRLAGVHHHELLRKGQGTNLAFAVRRMGLEFHRPASIDDLLEVHTQLLAQKGARIELTQEICRADVLLVEAKVMVAVVNESGRPVRLPQELEVQLKPLVQSQI